MLVEFKQKSQITIPKDLVKKLNLQVGDKLDVDIILENPQLPSLSPIARVI
ncbi:MAG TPA: hypothetical protein DEB05_14740 [Firmicutes bacterium]|jgi:AbrB family looped-hinge helix DNA binding protein|nr:hypothetical protein [Bacillota bacterium]